MKTERKHVTSGGLGMTDAFAMTETLGRESGLSKKELIQLRLLAEELFGALRSVAGDVEADYWLEIQGKSFEIHMESEVEVDEKVQQQMLSMSSSGENAAAKGFFGRLRVMIAETLLTKAAKADMKIGFQQGIMVMASPTAMNPGAYTWSMSEFKEEVAQHKAEEWDGLERSIVANIADDVKVHIVGDNVHIVLYKKFAE